ncbi:TPA: OprD family porin [Pseudomonas putida]|uniref:Outer membrane porin n=1 Tax=Pseudomonas putida (strain GB-1) TaxID=76869 RepID=B0KNR4_PSEPG|nr:MULTISPECIES: OprD family porin [Pseudomonas]ABY98187.1 outer membrane porin [Pseudomonas putida GB-1]APE98541.1 porin [Pseudomonas putida]MBP0709196.1 OprD family porin [Pseudomonas sp. T34]MCE1002617.1 OprD family porin [Pseudomonas sp. NMI1173_11]MCK2188636.1 OprD family porin [Pseudomonas sp. MB04B]
MTCRSPLKLAACLALASVGNQAMAAEESAEGFIEGSTLSVLNRNFYFNRDNRDSAAPMHNPNKQPDNGYSEAWAHAVITRFESGFTQGTVGVGLDAFAMLGLKLDTGGGRNGGRSSFDVMPVDRDGQARDEYTKVGGAAKVRLFDTVLKVGDVFPANPVVAAGDSRLLPESFRGVTLENTSIKDLTLQAGRLHAMSQPMSSDLRENFVTFYGGPVDSPWIAYGGGDYTLNDHVSVSLFSSRLKDVWNQYYAGTSLSWPLSDELALLGGFNYYKAVDEGQRRLGAFDNDIWSAKVGVRLGAHTLALTHQRNNGDDDFDYLRQSDSIFLDNSIQYSDFNSPKERSWMLRYDLNMAAYGVPGLSFMTRYGKGTDADYSNANATYMRRDGDGNPLTDQKRWERDIEVKYVVQTGAAKDLSLRVRQATTRATAFESDLDEVRLIVEYPLSIL